MAKKRENFVILLLVVGSGEQDIEKKIIIHVTEAVLETMRRIKPMLDQFKNNSGFIGPPGPPGPKGDPAPLPSGPKSKSY